MKTVITMELEKLKPELEACPGLWEMFRKCFMNTLETTIQETSEDTFVITGDIPAMWLRDSTAQVLHYLRFADREPVARMLEGLIARQTECILRDPYANAFNREPSDYKPFDDQPRANDWVWERKYEVDSLCYPLWLAEKYHRKTGNGRFLTERFHTMLRMVVDQFRLEQNHSESPYRFVRTNCPPGDTLTNEGMGAPVAVTGMTWSGFRPSDDACTYGYLVPSNLFAVRAMESAQYLAKLLGDAALGEDARILGREIAEGICKHAMVDHPKFGRIYAYEVDGLGNANCMDDANVPSLMALPYLEVCPKEDPLYLATRQFVLSEENPYYYSGSFACGVGSPHTPKGYIWPIALCVQAMTATDPEEISRLLAMLLNTHGNTGFMHESFDPNAPEEFTRSWFAWANSMFGELIYRLHEAGILNACLEKAMKEE